MDKNKTDFIELIFETFTKQSESIIKLKETTDYHVLYGVAETILKCKGKIILSGCGTSAAAGKKIVHTLSCLGISSVFLVPSDALHGSFGIVNCNDIVILLSRGGKTQEIVSLLPTLKIKKPKIILVTESLNASLANNADILVELPNDEEIDPFNMLATISTMKVILYFDVVALLVMLMKDYSRKDFLINHPGGAVGEKLMNYE